MKLIIGLGNPGQKYEKNRHNIGFMVVEQFLKDYEKSKDTLWKNQTKFKSDIAEFEWQPKIGPAEKIILAKPKTYMNNSGMTVQLLANFYKVQPQNTWIIHDDIDLPLGHFRIRLGGGDAGHRGLQSIILSLNNGSFWRFRLGIGRPKDQLNTNTTKGIDDYVLGNFTPQEWGKIRELIKRGTKAIEEALENGMDSAMNRYNIK